MSTQLPDGMTDGLRDFAAARTAGTTPWPRVRTAVRRDRRRRAVGASLTAAGLVAATIVAATTLLPSSPPAEPSGRDRPTPSPTISRPDPAPTAPPRALAGDADLLKLDGSTAGSLAKDTEWLAGLRLRALVDRTSFDVHAAVDLKDIRVLWATDHAGKRHALTLAEKDGTTAYLTLWRGNAGASPDDMHVEHRDTSSYPVARPLVEPTTYAIRTSDGDDGPGLMLAFGTGLMHVEMGTGGGDFDASGRRVVHWAPLQQQGAVFVRAASGPELDWLVMRAATTNGRWFRPFGAESWGDEPFVPPNLLGVAPPGANAKALTCAARGFAAAVGMPRGATAVLGATPKLGAEWIGLAVARAPSGGYLVGLCRTSKPDYSLETGQGQQVEGFVAPAPTTGARDLLLLLPCRRTGGPKANVTAVCVVAPEGTTEVEVAGVRAQVHDRVAVVEFDDPKPVDELKATAYRADGTAAGPVTRANGQEEVTAAALPPL